MVFYFKRKTAYAMRMCDWSTDVCSSDLPLCLAARRQHPVRGHPPVRRALFLAHRRRQPDPGGMGDRKSVVEGKSVSVRVDLGGGRILKKKKKNQLPIRTRAGSHNITDMKELDHRNIVRDTLDTYN